MLETEKCSTVDSLHASVHLYVRPHSEEQKNVSPENNAPEIQNCYKNDAASVAKMCSLTKCCVVISRSVQLCSPAIVWLRETLKKCAVVVQTCVS